MKGRGLYFISFTAVLLLIVLPASAQETDSLKKDITDSRIAKEIVNAISQESEKDTIFTKKAEEVFLPYQDKIIRKIIIQHIGFERNFYEGPKAAETIVNIGNKLHTDTREQIIRNHLFIREDKELNAYKVADNERYLRDLEFILDARIQPYKVGNDSVDLVVTTRDVFSLGGRFSPRSAKEVRFGVYDANLLGYGQRLEYNAIIDGDRKPTYGHEILYSKSSVKGTLINLTAAYSTINTGSRYGDEYENSTYLRLNRPLVSPYTRMAGGIEISHNWSSNIDLKPDSLFLKYSYNIFDTWAGYNIGANNTQKRNRYFIALRGFHQDFRSNPMQEITVGNPRYHNNSFVLSELTFFQQNFYKTRYIYGFGRTEDVPYGRTINLTAGWTDQLDVRRFYVGSGFTNEAVTDHGDFFESNVQASTFYHDGPEDITVLLSFSWFSRLRHMKRAKVRQSLKATYTAIWNQTISPLLEIGNDFGAPGFRADSLLGVQRLAMTSETVIFTNWKLLGFKFAPIAYALVAFLPPKDKHLFYDKPIIGIGTGVRTRNENLIFGTIEMRVTYFPRVVENINHFRFNISTNLRIKYSDSFVRAPSFLRVN